MNFKWFTDLYLILMTADDAKCFKHDKQRQQNLDGLNGFCEIQVGMVLNYSTLAQWWVGTGQLC